MLLDPAICFVIFNYPLILCVFGWCRWQISYSAVADPGCKVSGLDWSSVQSPVELVKRVETDRAREKEVFQRAEWFGHMMRFRNDFIIFLSIICLQLPFELAYAHLYEVTRPDALK